LAGLKPVFATRAGVIFCSSAWTFHGLPGRSLEGLDPGEGGAEKAYRDGRRLGKAIDVHQYYMNCFKGELLRRDRMVQSLMSLSDFRGIERLVISMAGVLSIYLGYKLFLVVSDSVGELEAEAGNNKLMIRRVGPGVFFALFGAVILALGIYSGLDMDKESGTADELQPGRVHYSYQSPLKNLDLEDMLKYIQSINVILKTKYLGFPGEKNDIDNYHIAVGSLEQLREVMIKKLYGAECYERYLEIKVKSAKSEKYMDNISDKDMQCYNNINPLLSRSTK